MDELEPSLQRFADFLLKSNITPPKAAPYFVRWVRRFLSRPASPDTLADQVRQFVEELERSRRWEAWQVRQAEQAVRTYLVNFLRTEGRAPVSEEGAIPSRQPSQLAATEELRRLLRIRHYSYRTSTLLPTTVRDALRTQIAKAETLFRADRAAGIAGVWMPDALERKYPAAGRDLGWFWVFPSQTLSVDPRAGIVRRHHLSESVLQKAVKSAVRVAGRMPGTTTVTRASARGR